MDSRRSQSIWCLRVVEAGILEVRWCCEEYEDDTQAPIVPLTPSDLVQDNKIQECDAKEHQCILARLRSRVDLLFAFSRRMCLISQRPTGQLSHSEKRKAQTPFVKMGWTIWLQWIRFEFATDPCPDPINFEGSTQDIRRIQDMRKEIWLFSCHCHGLCNARPRNLRSIFIHFPPMFGLSYPSLDLRDRCLGPSHWSNEGESGGYHCTLKCKMGCMRSWH